MVAAGMRCHAVGLMCGMMVMVQGRITGKGAVKQQLFDEAYRPDDSRHFEVSASSTFKPDTSRQFDLAYADGTELKGFNAHDIVQLGNFHGLAPFGVITDCNSPDFNGVDGILGFGLPKPGFEGRQLPRPILWALTDKGVQDSNAQALTRKFSFFSTDSAAELQLGGYDPATCTDVMLYTPSLSSTDFIVGVTSLKYGHPSRSDHTELLKFKDPTGEEYLPAIMDSGTSCLVMPGDNMDGKLQNSPFDDFTELWDEDTSFWITIGGHTFEIPYHSWFLAETNQTCVQPSPDGMQGLLIGDVFFREYMVEFDMQDEARPIIGIAKLNKAYSPVTQNELGYYKLDQAPRAKLQLLKGEETMFSAEHSKKLDEVDQVPIFNKKGTQYFMDLAIGTPQQPFTVIFDTGSAVFGVFTVKSKLPSEIRQQLASSSSFKIRVDSMNTLMQWDQIHGKAVRDVELGQQGQAVSLALAGSSLSRGRTSSSVSGMSFAGGLLILALIANIMVGLAYVSRQRRGRAKSTYTEMLYSSNQYGSVPVTISAPQPV
eukprot:754890-Hanusia_phi.AAC.1